MSNTLFKKVTASAAALSIVLSVVAPVVGVRAADASVDAANRLASLGVIVDNSQDPSKYNLGSNITRREMLKVMMNLSSVEVTETCEGKFSDLPASDWGCKYAEAALKAGFIAANAKFRPNDMVTEAEALKMVMQARGVAAAEGVQPWGEAYRQAAVTAGVLSAETTVSATSAAKRSMVIVSADSAVSATTGTSSEEDDTEVDLGDLLGDLFGEDGEDLGTNSGSTSTGSTSTGSTSTETNTTVKAGELEVTLNPATPSGADLPKTAEGVAVAKFDITAGSADVSISSVKLTRKGLGSSDVVETVALFANDLRVSKGKDFNDSTDLVELNLSPALVVKAGSTVTLTAKVNTENTTGTFAVELTDLVSSAVKVNGLGVSGNKFEVKNTSATSITLKQDGSSVNPKLGQDQSELFKFSVKNNAENNEDVSVSEITLKEDSSIDETTELANVALYYNGKEVAKVASMTNKYVTFKLVSPILIKEGKTEKFSVKADVIGGAGDTVSFIVDNDLDITATSSKYGYVSIDSSLVDTKGETGELTVQAGELTLVDLDAPSDIIREDKDDVVLGTVKVTNIAGKNLELQEFGVKATLTPGTATSGGVALTLAKLFENFELYNRDTGTSYDLKLSGNVYSDADLNITIPQGTSTFDFRADTLKDITNFDAASVEFNITVGSVGANGGLKVVETEDDKEVTDITPSSLSFKKVKGTESGATVSLTPLANVTKVRGTDGTVALQFEVEADESSSIVIDEAKVFIAKNDGTKASNLEVKEATLYKGTVAEANLLDRVSGSSLAEGVATFDGFEAKIGADQRETFVVTLSIVDGADAVAAVALKAKLNSLSIEDEDRDDVTVSGTPSAFSRNITVTNFGTLTLTQDINNDDNKNTKTILAGESMKVFSVDVQASNENVDVETVTFTVASAAGSIKKAVSTATLYLGNDEVGTATNADITDTTITFKNLTKLIVPQESKELRLALNTANIGFEKVGQTVTGFDVTAVTLDDAEGVSSGKSVTKAEDLAISTDKVVAIVPATVLPVVVSTLTGGQSKLKIVVNTGNNTVAGSNSKPSVLLTDLVFSGLGNNTDGYEIYKDGESARKGTITPAGVFAQGAMTAADLTISSDTTYVIVPKGTKDSTYTLNLTKDGVVYSVGTDTGLKSNLTTELELGTKTY